MARIDADRGQVLTVLAGLPKCIVAMESANGKDKDTVRVDLERHAGQRASGSQK